MTIRGFSKILVLGAPMLISRARYIRILKGVGGPSQLIAHMDLAGRLAPSEASTISATTTERRILYLFENSRSRTQIQTCLFGAAQRTDLFEANKSRTRSSRNLEHFHLYEDQCAVKTILTLLSELMVKRDITVELGRGVHTKRAAAKTLYGEHELTLKIE
jgi:hypothetical protein